MPTSKHGIELLVLTDVRDRMPSRLRPRPIRHVTPAKAGVQGVAGITAPASEPAWWRWIPAQARNDALRAGDRLFAGNVHHTFPAGKGTRAECASAGGGGTL